MGSVGAHMQCYVCSARLYKKPRDWMKESRTCVRCLRVICLRHTRRYVDGSNKSITQNAPAYCLDCFSVLHDEYGDIRLGAA